MLSGFIYKSRYRTPPFGGEGFTLLEMTIVIAIMGVVMAGGAVMFAASLQKREADETSFKLQQLQQALFNFRLANNRLPCPADLTQSITGAYFGVEPPDLGTCTSNIPVANVTMAGDEPPYEPYESFFGGQDYAVITGGDLHSGQMLGVAVGATVTCVGGSCSGYFPSPLTVTGMQDNVHYTFIPPMLAFGGSTNGYVAIITAPAIGAVGGMVPTKALQLPDDFAFDGWGRRIFYAVDPVDTLTNTFSNLPLNAVIPHITVNDLSGNARTTQALYVLLSYGPNGHGAYPRNGGTTRISSHSSNADELTNCHCTNTTANGTLTALFVQHAPTQDTTTITHTNDFDDMLVYGTRTDLRLLNE